VSGSPISTSQTDVIEEASLALSQISAAIELIAMTMSTVRLSDSIIAEALHGSAAYARLHAHRLDQLASS
jgi:hypothetical protein